MGAGQPRRSSPAFPHPPQPARGCIPYGSGFGHPSSSRRAYAPTPSGRSMTCSWLGASCVEACMPAKTRWMQPVHARRTRKGTTSAPSQGFASRCSTFRTANSSTQSHTTLSSSAIPTTLPCPAERIRLPTHHPGAQALAPARGKETPLPLRQGATTMVAAGILHPRTHPLTLP